MTKENKRYLKLLVIYSFLTLFLILLIFKFGIAGAVKISELLQKNDKEVTSSNIYENVLSSPQLYPILEATNSAELPIAGYSQPNKKVDIYLNEFNVKTFDVDSEGKFDDYISLGLGLNNIYAVTKDVQGKESLPSKTLTIFYNNNQPGIEITEPENGSTIKKTSNIFIKGKVLETSKVTINDHQAVIVNDGYFSYSVKLESGENKFKIVCSDPAQNKTEMEWILHFQP